MKEIFRFVWRKRLFISDRCGYWEVVKVKSWRTAIVDNNWYTRQRITVFVFPWE